MNITNKNTSTDCDVILIGAGVMSVTLGAMLKELNSNIRIDIYERLDRIAGESTDAWNNAGTGHSALCELNYTPLEEDGTVNISKAVKVIESFEISKQFWAYLVGQGYFCSPKDFINQIPHMSFVEGQEDVEYLKKRFEALQKCHLFEGMKFSNDFEEIKTLIPLMMEGRNEDEPIAVTFTNHGTDLNFGTLTRSLCNHLKDKFEVDIFLNHEVETLEQQDDNTWKLRVEDKLTGQERYVTAQFVFIGAGGGSLKLLEKSDIPEADGYGGFPISGQWLVCNNEQVIAQHGAKVYGKAKVGTPPMSVPHLDSRMINGKKELLFGPFAGFSTKFLKEGSYLDLPVSISFGNILPMLNVGIHNLPLTKYLIQQVMLSMEEKVDVLRAFIPTAKDEDWELAIAGQRVQVIRKDEEEGGVLEFGTEVVTAKDGTIAALLGASPGASTSVAIMLEVMEECFPELMQSSEWKEKLAEMISSYGKPLKNNEALTKQIREFTFKVLGA
jgi:malate dehydrogenase (quinone)